MSEIMQLKGRARFEAAILYVVQAGWYPGPKAILKELGRKGHSLNGQEIKWRAEYLFKLGWSRDPRATKETWRTPGVWRPRFAWIPPSKESD